MSRHEIHKNMKRVEKTYRRPERQRTSDDCPICNPQRSIWKDNNEYIKNLVKKNKIQEQL